MVAVKIYYTLLEEVKCQQTVAEQGQKYLTEELQDFEADFSPLPWLPSSSGHQHLSPR